MQKFFIILFMILGSFHSICSMQNNNKIIKSNKMKTIFNQDNNSIKLLLPNGSIPQISKNLISKPKNPEPDYLFCPFYGTLCKFRMLRGGEIGSHIACHTQHIKCSKCSTRFSGTTEAKYHINKYHPNENASFFNDIQLKNIHTALRHYMTNPLKEPFDFNKKEDIYEFKKLLGNDEVGDDFYQEIQQKIKEKVEKQQQEQKDEEERKEFEEQQIKPKPDYLFCPFYGTLCEFRRLRGDDRHIAFHTRHIASHTRHIKCSKCSKRFSTPTEAKYHINRYHPNENASFFNDIQLKNIYTALRHYMTNPLKEPFDFNRKEDIYEFKKLLGNDEVGDDFYQEIQQKIQEKNLKETPYLQKENNESDSFLNNDLIDNELDLLLNKNLDDNNTSNFIETNNNLTDEEINSILSKNLLNDENENSSLLDLL